MKVLRGLIVGCVALTSASTFAQDPEAAYKQLREGSTIFVDSRYKFNIDKAQIEQVANQVKPLSLKVLAVPSLGSRWISNGREQRGAFAKYVADTKLTGVDQPVVIVLTRQGISAYTNKLSKMQLASLSDQAGVSAKSDNLTSTIAGLATSVKSATLKTRTSVGIPSTDVAAPRADSSSAVGGWVCFLIPVAIFGIIAATIFGGAKRALVAKRKEADAMKAKSVDAISYLDSYDGLLSDETDASAVRQYRDRMAQNFDEANNLLKDAKNTVGIENAKRYYQLVLQDFASAKQHIEHATGGSGVAFTIPPIVDPNRAPLLDPVSGTSFFSSEPSDQLVPVEINFGGSRRTVMVTQAERDEMMQGRMPQMRGTHQNGQFVPWWQVQGYNPHGGFGSGNFIWDMMALSAITNMFTPHYGMGGYGHQPPIIINNYDHAGGFGSDYGGGDFGGGDFGGGDFGGGDFGGGDFGGGDFGGGDFGGDF